MIQAVKPAWPASIPKGDEGGSAVKEGPRLACYGYKPGVQGIYLLANRGPSLVTLTKEGSVFKPPLTIKGLIFVNKS